MLSRWSEFKIHIIYIYILNLKGGGAIAMICHYLYPLCLDIGITHLVYVDDLLIFAWVNESTINLIVDCIQTFGD